MEVYFCFPTLRFFCLVPIFPSNCDTTPSPLLPGLVGGTISPFFVYVVLPLTCSLPLCRIISSVATTFSFGFDFEGPRLDPAMAD